MDQNTDDYLKNLPPEKKPQFEEGHEDDPLFHDSSKMQQYILWKKVGTASTAMLKRERTIRRFKIYFLLTLALIGAAVVFYKLWQRYEVSEPQVSPNKFIAPAPSDQQKDGVIPIPSADIPKGQPVVEKQADGYAAIEQEQTYFENDNSARQRGINDTSFLYKDDYDTLVNSAIFFISESFAEPYRNLFIALSKNGLINTSSLPTNDSTTLLKAFQLLKQHNPEEAFKKFSRLNNADSPFFIESSIGLAIAYHAQNEQAKSKLVWEKVAKKVMEKYPELSHLIVF